MEEIQNSPSVVCFDIGTKNLAFCFLKQVKGGQVTKYEIRAWENVNILADPNALPPPEKTQCYGCKQKASYEGTACVRHTPRPPLTDLSGNKLLRFPSISTLRTILLQKDPHIKKSASKDQILAGLRKYYSLPLVEAAKPPKAAVDHNLSILHDRIRTLVKQHKTEWDTATEFCLENQPVFKNPHMKSIQLLLFATLRDILTPTPTTQPTVRFVHAGMKVKGKATGDKGYKDRKKGSEDRVKDALQSGILLDPNGCMKRYEAAKKKDDFADAFSMAMDALKKWS